MFKNVYKMSKNIVLFVHITNYFQKALYSELLHNRKKRREELLGKQRKTGIRRINSAEATAPAERPPRQLRRTNSLPSRNIKHRKFEKHFWQNNSRVRNNSPRIRRRGHGRKATKFFVRPPDRPRSPRRN